VTPVRVTPVKAHPSCPSTPPRKQPSPSPNSLSLELGVMEAYLLPTSNPQNPNWIIHV
jgi:hypothetical protein